MEPPTVRMRIAYVVDVHGSFDAVTRVLSDAGRVDVLVVGGDITTAGTADEAAAAIELWRPLAPRLFAVAGNMDSPAIDARLAELGIALDGRGETVDDVGFFGVSGSPRTPMHTPYELDEDELERRIEAGWAEVSGSGVTILCPHAPPHGTSCDRLRSGTHVGSRSVRSFVERAQPDVVLCGHVHESRGVDTIGRTQIANPGPVGAGHYALVEIGESVTVTLD
jgi:Icc-related predicted phosphoesterase